MEHPAYTMHSARSWLHRGEQNTQIPSVMEIKVYQMCQHST